MTATAAEVGDISRGKDPENDEGTDTSEGSKYTKTTAGHSSQPSKIILHLSWSVMTSEEICSAADRLSLSDNQTTAMVSAVLKSEGTDLDDFVMSASTTRRNKINTCDNLCQSYMNGFKDSPPNYCSLHWDGKLVRDVFGKT